MYFMTQQNQNPEKPKRIEITKAGLDPKKIEMKKEGLGGNAGRIILEKSSFPEGDVSRPISGETVTAKGFKEFVEPYLPKDADRETEKSLKWREARFSTAVARQLVPVSEVIFTEFRDKTDDDGPKGPDVSRDYVGIELLDKSGRSLRDFRYDEVHGFVEVSERDGMVSVDPSEAYDLISTLDSRNVTLSPAQSVDA